MSPRKPKAEINYVEALAPFLTDYVPKRRRRADGAPKKSNREKETTKVLGHIKIIKDEARAQAAWALIQEQKGLPQKKLSAKQVAFILKKHAKKYHRANEPRIRNRLSAAKTWLKAGAPRPK